MKMDNLNFMIKIRFTLLPLQPPCGAATLTEMTVFR